MLQRRAPMKTLRSLALIVALSTLSSWLAAQADTVALTSVELTVRVRPLVTAPIVTRLPAGTQVRLGACAEGWCRVTAGRSSGYALEEYLTRQAPPAQQAAGRGYINSDGQWVQSPTRTADGLPPAGATAHCRDGTYSFSQHRQGTCSHHGGVARWLGSGTP
jgi:uncharacterized protein YraI